MTVVRGRRRVFKETAPFKVCHKYDYERWMNAIAQGRTPFGDSQDEWVIEFIEASKPAPVLERNTATWFIAGSKPAWKTKKQCQLSPGSVAYKRGRHGGKRAVVYLMAGDMGRVLVRKKPKAK